MNAADRAGHLNDLAPVLMQIAKGMEEETAADAAFLARFQTVIQAKIDDRGIDDLLQELLSDAKAGLERQNAAIARKTQVLARFGINGDGCVSNGVAAGIMAPTAATPRPPAKKPDEKPAVLTADSLLALIPAKKGLNLQEICHAVKQAGYKEDTEVVLVVLYDLMFAAKVVKEEGGGKKTYRRADLRGQ